MNTTKHSQERELAMTTPLDDLLLAARQRGEEDARAAATWSADGNTPKDAIRRTLTAMDAGDPEAFDWLPPMPNLSGEWSDDLTPVRLVVELTGREAHTIPEGWFDAAADAYDDGVSAEFAQACERELRGWVA